MPTRNINLTPHLDEFVERRVASGEYGNASEVVRDGLRLLEGERKLHDAKLKALRKATRDGFDALERGDSVLLKNAGDIDAFVEEIGTEVRSRKPNRKRVISPAPRHRAHKSAAIERHGDCTCH